VTYFPFDDQICYLKFGSWAYSGLEVDLTNRSHEVDLSNYIKSGEWDLRTVTVKRYVKVYSCCPNEPFPDVKFCIHIRRRTLYFVMNILFPCLLLSAISVMTFWLPPDSGEKITLSITVLLAFSVFMLLIAENIPATSETVPLIGVYLAVVMFLTSLSIVLTIFILEVHHATQYAPHCPQRLYSCLAKTIAPRIGLRDLVARFETSQNNASILSQMTTYDLMDSEGGAANAAANEHDGLLLHDGAGSGSHQSRKTKLLMHKKLLADYEHMVREIRNEWKLMALIVDRVLFWVFMVLTGVSSILLLVVIPLLKNMNLLHVRSIEEEPII
jgi:nicotinic acetylcholine receptor